MAPSSARPTLPVRINPRRALLLSGLLVVVVVPLPLFTTLLTLGGRVGSWPVAIAGEAVCLVVALIGFLLFRTTYVLVTDTDLVERGFIHAAVSTPLTEVHSSVLAQTYSGATSETLPQLIVRNELGERILRMRGAFWTEAAMRQAAAAIGRPLEEPAEPLTPAQFFERFAGSAYWWENRRPLAITMIVVIGLLCVGIVLGLMALLGLPILL